MAKTTRRSSAKIEAIRTFYEGNRETARASMGIPSFAISLGVSTSTVKKYAVRLGLANRNRKQFAADADPNRKTQRYEVDPITGCWNWLLSKTPEGYGHEKSNGKGDCAHRVVYRDSGRTIPPGFELHHKCENPSCVNPDHLEPLAPTAHDDLHGPQKLSRADVSEIVGQLRSGLTQTAVAAKFNVSPSMVSLIASNRRHRSVCR